MRIPHLCIAIALGGAVSLTDAAPLKEARINRVQRDVRITEASGTAKPASEGQRVQGSQGVKTGAQSAAELQFPDTTLARLGSDTLFTFETGTRKMNLESGTLLFQIPKNVGGASIRTGAITAAITGTTGFIERGPSHYKLVLLEGTMRIFLNDRLRESMLVNGGQMLIGPIKSKSIKDWQTVQIDTAKLLKTSKLLNRDNFDALPAEASQKIDDVIAKQNSQLNKGDLSTTNLVIDGYGTTLLAVANASEVQPEAMPTPNGNTTPAPTAIPAPSPTPGPTPTPSVSPTAAPTPTPFPTVVPTPTSNPTPTPIPTSNPTPTPVPTSNPTPTPVPTAAPSPTPLPSVAPTPTANPSPTPVPTTNPTPTSAPTPTPVPTVAPSPTPVPTVNPTPTSAPTPTPGPTVTPTPTVAPTPSPAPSPTPLPTNAPTPTPAPTATPTGEPDARYPGVDRSATASPTSPTPSPVNAKPVVITNPSPYTISADSIINLQASQPVIINKTRPRPGTIYSGTSSDGSPSTFLFNTESDFDAQTNFNTRFGANYDRPFPSGGVTVFAFEKLVISNTPKLVGTNAAKDLALISEDSLEVTGPLSLNQFTNLSLLNKIGDLKLLSDGTITATNTDFQFLHLYNRDGGVELAGSLTLPTADLYIDAAKDVIVKTETDLVIRRGLFNSTKKIEISNTVRADYLQLDATEEISLKSNLLTKELFALTEDKITVENPITATPANTDTKGGTVSLQAADEIVVERAIQANAAPVANGSGAGATVALKSKKLTGTAITIMSTGQLKALLDQAGIGPGGKVTVTSAGGTIAINGTVIAEKGTIDIQNTGTGGQINLTSTTLSADVIKAGVVGPNGTLNIGGGSISADTLLRLYANGSNGRVNFVENVTLGGNSSKIISGNTVRISNGKVVTINGPSAAQVYTNNPQYTGSGGNNATSGTFGNQGATTSPLSSLPPE